MSFDCEQWIKSQMSANRDQEQDQYFEQLMADRTKLLELHPMTFQHLGNLLNQELRRVMDESGEQKDGNDSASLPDEGGPTVNIVEKLYIMNEKYPVYNFAGRILGPRGITVKQLEQRSGCKIEVRGRGSFKTSPVGKDEPLHVIITVQDTESRAKAKLARAKAELSTLVNLDTDGMDEIKKKQLMELAIINGNYRPPGTVKSAITPVMTSSGPQISQIQMPTPQPAYFLVNPGAQTPFMQMPQVGQMGQMSQMGQMGQMGVGQMPQVRNPAGLPMMNMMPRQMGVADRMMMRPGCAGDTPHN